MTSPHFARRKINGEDAVEFYNGQGKTVLTALDHECADEWSPASYLLVPLSAFKIEFNADGDIVIELTADQVFELGRFCIDQFVGSMGPAIATIENNVAYVRSALESWNARARADEEHPPYDDLVRRLDEITSALRGLEPLRRMK